MSAKTKTGLKTCIDSGYVAYGEIDQSEGRQGTYEIGRYTTKAEALEAARWKGTQGDAGYVSQYAVYQYEGGGFETISVPITKRRKTPEGNWLVGWVTPGGNYSEFDCAPDEL